MKHYMAFLDISFPCQPVDCKLNSLTETSVHMKALITRPSKTTQNSKIHDAPIVSELVVFHLWQPKQVIRNFDNDSCSGISMHQRFSHKLVKNSDMVLTFRCQLLKYSLYSDKWSEFEQQREFPGRKSFSREGWNFKAIKISKITVL